MREILFKAKRIDNKEWVEGFLFETQENTYIAYDKQFDDDLFLSPQNIFICIDKDTLCQYTGLTDKNGNKIWENDICRYIDGDENGIKEETFVVKYGRHAELFKINMGFYIDWIKTNYYRCDLVFWTENRNIEVIGNVFDNT